MSQSQNGMREVQLSVSTRALNVLRSTFPNGGITVRNLLSINWLELPNCGLTTAREIASLADQLIALSDGEDFSVPPFSKLRVDYTTLTRAKNRKRREDVLTTAATIDLPESVLRKIEDGVSRYREMRIGAAKKRLAKLMLAKTKERV